MTAVICKADLGPAGVWARRTTNSHSSRDPSPAWPNNKMPKYGRASFRNGVVRDALCLRVLAALAHRDGRAGRIDCDGDWLALAAEANGDPSSAARIFDGIQRDLLARFAHR